MIERWIAIAATAMVAGALSACATAPMHEEVRVEELKHVPGDLFHEWAKVFSVTQQGRTHIGFTDRRFSNEDLEGKVFVFDLMHNERGFVLPEGKAFSFEFVRGELVGSEDLGNTGFDNGVKRILKAPGAIEYELVTAASTRPAEPE